MNVLDLFSGIGGFSLGLERAGMRTVAFCEIEPFCRGVLARHWPGVRIIDDVRSAAFPEADIICGGFPCQDVSYAGRRAGVTGKRSGLYREVLRAIRLVRPKFTILENVAALLGNGMGRVLGDVAEDGLDAEWDCISAGELGAPHGRDRVWIILADADQWQPKGRSRQSAGWWLWSQEETEAARDANGEWQLQPPRLLGDIRRRVDNATRGRAWWECDWQTKFASFRRMDDGLPDGLDHSPNTFAVAALGNTLIPEIPEIIGQAIMSLALSSQDGATK
jgi:DNA (cytosine-5)-methyltransferase 1